MNRCKISSSPENAEFTAELKGRGSGLVFIVSAPSGTGKSTLIRKLMEEVKGLRFSVSYTTRLPRNGEQQGKDYHFVSPAVFKRMVKGGQFLEWAEVMGNLYGTAVPNLRELSAENMDLILDIDVQGAKSILEQMGSAVSIFILPPSPEVLEHRLTRRGLDAPEVIRLRLANAKKEIQEADRYRYVLLNERLEEAVELLKSIILAERCRKAKQWLYQKKRIEWEVCYGKNHG